MNCKEAVAAGELAGLGPLVENGEWQSDRKMAFDMLPEYRRRAIRCIASRIDPADHDAMHVARAALYGKVVDFRPNRPYSQKFTDGSIGIFVPVRKKLFGVGQPVREYMLLAVVENVG